MQLGMIGLGRMGSNMVQRPLKDGHDRVVHDSDPHGHAGADIKTREVRGPAARVCADEEYAAPQLSAMRYEFGGHLGKAKTGGR